MPLPAPCRARLKTEAERVRLYHNRFFDAGEQVVKSNAGGGGADDCVMEYNLIEFTAGPSVVEHGGGTGYTGGLHAHETDRWVIRHNLWRNFHTPDWVDHQYAPTVLMWNHSADTVVEGNTFVGCDRAVAFGLVDLAGQPDHSGGAIRNNFVYQRPGLFTDWRRANSDGQLLAYDSPGTVIAHNTVMTNGNSRFSPGDAVGGGRVPEQPDRRAVPRPRRRDVRRERERRHGRPAHVHQPHGRGPPPPRRAARVGRRNRQGGPGVRRGGRLGRGRAAAGIGVRRRGGRVRAGRVAAPARDAAARAPFPAPATDRPTRPASPARVVRSSPAGRVRGRRGRRWVAGRDALPPGRDAAVLYQGLRGRLHRWGASRGRRLHRRRRRRPGGRDRAGRRGTGPGAGRGATGRELFATQPFGAAFTSGVHVAAGNITGAGFSGGVFVG